MHISPRVWGTAFAVVLTAQGAGAARGDARPILQTVSPAAPVSAFVKLPLRNARELHQLLELQSDPHSPLYHHFLTPAQFAARYGATPESLSRVARSLEARGMVVTSVTSQGLEVRTNASTAERAFSVRMQPVRTPDGAVRLRAGAPLSVPVELAREGATVIGLSGHAVGARPHSRIRGPISDNRYSPYGGYWFTDLKQAYDFPAYSAANGKGATIGIVMSNDVRDADLQAYFDHEKFSQISGAPTPRITRHPVNGGSPFDINASFEASLDVQQSLGSAPGANLILYTTPDLSDQSILAAYAQVVFENKADVISSSFGGCELFYTAGYNGGVDYTHIIKAEDELFQQGNAQGQTFVASSGDNSGLGCPSPDYFNPPGTTTAHFVPGVETPADSPHVTAVGGTNLTTTAPKGKPSGALGRPSAYVDESEFGDPLIAYDPYGVGNNVAGGLWGSGSGKSVVFERPNYQRGLGIDEDHRAVPDVSMQMGGCPGGIALSCGKDDSFSIVADGVGLKGGGFFGVIGTSASAPEFAGLLALNVAYHQSRLGNANEFLYDIDNSHEGINYHQNIPGFNGVVHESERRHRYNRIVGLGTPNAENIVGTDSERLAGVPGSASNP